MTGLVVGVVAAPALLWVFFLAVMHLRDAHKDGTLATLSWTVRWLAYVVLFAGYVLDAFVQVTAACVVWWELPPRRAKFPWFEPTVSARVERWYTTTPGTWGWKAARWVRNNLLMPFDKSGGHGKADA